MSDEYTTKDSGEREEYPSGMRRDITTGKTLWHLVTDGPMLERYAGLLTRGAEKYGPSNWQLADSEEERDRFKASAFRHFMQWYNGETDEDHAAAVWFNINGAEHTQQKLESSPMAYAADGRLGKPIFDPEWIEQYGEGWIETEVYRPHYPTGSLDSQDTPQPIAADDLEEEPPNEGPSLFNRLFR